MNTLKNKLELRHAPNIADTDQDNMSSLRRLFHGICVLGYPYRDAAGRYPLLGMFIVCESGFCPDAGRKTGNQTLDLLQGLGRWRLRAGQALSGATPQFPHIVKAQHDPVAHVLKLDAIDHSTFR
jgi:hypothetical protein